MATAAEKRTRMIFPEAANQPQQSQQPWWAQGNSISERGATPVGRGRRRRRNVFYDAQTGAPTSNPGNTIGSGANDLELIREIMKPRSSIVVNDPSGWLDGRASQDFQKFFSRTPEQEANYARRKRELDAGSVANINPAVTRNAVEVARQNQEAMDMIFPKAPQGSGQPTSTDVTKQSMPGGGFNATLDGRYGTGSSTVIPQTTAMTQRAPMSATEPAQQSVADLFAMPQTMQAPAMEVNQPGETPWWENIANTSANQQTAVTNQNQTNTSPNFGLPFGQFIQQSVDALKRSLPKPSPSYFYR